MYFIDFFKGITRKSNIPIFIYFILNLFVIGLIVQLLFDNPFWQALLMGIVLYFVSIVIALSPIGEWILRLQTGCKKITRIEQIERIMPLFEEVYNNAKVLDASIPNDVKLYIHPSNSMNAFATGRKTICITKGLLNAPSKQIKSVLAHEFGHLSNKDTDLILIISVGNLIITSIVTAIRLYINLMQLIFSFVCLFIGREGFIASLLNMFTGFLISIFVTGVMWLWTKIGVLLVMKSSRTNEYLADKFCFALGYGDELCAFLDNFETSNLKGLFANLVSSHPDNDDRIGKLQQLGVSYRKNYSNE